jgi:hypothetical protein
MTTTYNFKCLYTKAGVAFNPSSAPIISIDDGTNILVASDVTLPAALVGEFRYSYIGIDNLNLMGLFHTNDTSVDKQDLSIVPDIVPPDNASIAAIKAQTDQIVFTNSLTDVNVVTWNGDSVPPISSGGTLVPSGSYTIGNLVTVSVVFRDSNGDPTDPSTITLEVRDPNNVVNTYVYGASAIVRDDVGKYHYDIDVEVAGLWTYFWQGGGAGQGSGGRTFNVVNPFVPPVQVPLF